MDNRFRPAPGSLPLGTASIRCPLCGHVVMNLAEERMTECLRCGAAFRRCETCAHAEYSGGDWHPYGMGWAREPGGWLCGHADPPEDENEGLEWDCKLWQVRP